MATDALNEDADHLYGLAPEEFTAARNARVREVKPDDRELAARIQELRKPSPAAFLVNQLVRRKSDEIDDLLDLGVELREAQGKGDGRQLNRLARERRGLIGELLDTASAIAEEFDRDASRAVLDEVEQTLAAGTVDEPAGDALRSGRLMRGLQAVGFDPVDLDGAVAGEPMAASARPKRERRGAEAATKADERAATEESEREAREHAKARAEFKVREARARAEEADKELRAATEQADAAEGRLEELRDEREELSARLDEVRREITEAERRARTTERDRGRAEKAAEQAHEELDDATAKRG
ncbi:hypothetical protein [Agromyces albus]|uniref:Uncharacterized protein n=1 Tax=Agromyces albus TaxID=205332 RepID=A0A4Q2KYM1_9MICO|nr:hypothetical protein [Agromyces albus]RXZ69083.1 hypothetical protein ESP51_12615 [Agromyces albus]